MNSHLARIPELWRNNLEFRRQLLHLLVTLALACLIRFNLLGFFSLAVIIFAGTVLSFLACKKNIPLISPLLDLFERPAVRRHWPGRGVLLLFMASLILLALFPVKTVFYALIITAVGDALSPLIGIFFGRVKLPWNERKHLEGLLFSIFITTLVLMFWIKFSAAFLSSLVTMIAESLSLKIMNREIDDNLIVPLVAAIMLSLTI